MNTQNLDTFTQFIDFVKNLDNFSAAVEQLKQVKKEQEAALDLLTQGQTLKAYENRLDASKDRLNFERSEFDKTSKVQNDVLVNRAGDLNDVESKLNSRKAELDKKESDLEDFSSSLQQKASDLNKKEQDLNWQIFNFNLRAEVLSQKEQALQDVFKKG